MFDIIVDPNNNILYCNKNMKKYIIGTGDIFGTNQKQKYRSFAIIPDIVAVDIKTKFGIDVHDPQNSTDELQKIRSIIIGNYPHLLTGNIVKNPKGR